MHQEIINILAKYSENDVKSITENSSLQSDLKLSSLDVVNIVVELEEMYNISISDEEIMGITRVNDIVDCLEKKCGK